MTALNELTLNEARKQILAGEITSVDLVSSCADRINQRDAQIGAWAHLDVSAALEAAKEADEDRREALAAGFNPLHDAFSALHGLPIGVKDILDTAALPTENGTPAMAGRTPDVNAVAVDLLMSAGAIIAGKTVTTELALFTPRGTRNPVDLTCSPGGSSAGSAAAVADFHVPAALATQTAGSILRPASYCGVIGFKPTFDIVPTTGALCQAAPLDTIGVIARSVDDVALVTDAITMMAAATVSRLAEARTFGQARPRIARLHLPVDQDADPAALAALDAFV
ncbi:MAG: amidase, partial [Pseudomonadota bacterium]